MENFELVSIVVIVLSKILLVYDVFNDVIKLGEINFYVKKVVDFWVVVEWFIIWF